MKKLTAEKCRDLIEECQALQERDFLSISGEYKLQALEIALAVLEKKEHNPKIDNDGWIEWRGGKQPIASDRELAIKFRDGTVMNETHSDCWVWSHGGDDDDIIAYRVIENDGSS